MPMKKYNIAVLYDYENVALESAAWSVLREQADIAVFHDHLAEVRKGTACTIVSPIRN